jgi:hypothetical protein
MAIMGHDARMLIHLKDYAFATYLWSQFDTIGIVGAQRAAAVSTVFVSLKER